MENFNKLKASKQRADTLNVGVCLKPRTVALVVHLEKAALRGTRPQSSSNRGDDVTTLAILPLLLLAFQA